MKQTDRLALLDWEKYKEDIARATPVGCHVGSFIEAFHLVAFHFQTEVSVRNGIAALFVAFHRCV